MSSAHNGFPLAPRVLNVSLTERCTAACAMCVTESHPRKEGAEPSEEDLLSWLESARSLSGLEAVCTIGGEPFLRPAALALLARRARALGWKSAAVTNCFWAGSADESRRVLSPLFAAGLTRITVSADGFHAPFVPIERVDNAIGAARELGLRVNLNCVASPGWSLARLRRELSSFGALDRAEAFPCLPVGRGRALPAAEREVPEGPCTLVVSTLSIKPGGDVYACCGVGGFTAPLRLGHAREPLRVLVERAIGDPLILALAIHGPRRLAGLAGTHATGADACHLCHRLLSDPSRAAALRERLTAAAAGLEVEHAILAARCRA